MADRHHHRRWNVVDSVREVGQVAQREVVGPQHVIDQDRNRLLFGDVDRQPVETMNDAEFIKRLSRSEDWLGHCGRAVHQFGACFGVRADKRGLKKRTNDAEWMIAGQLATACPQDRQSEPSGGTGALVEQTRRADPAGPFDDTDLPAAGLSRG